MLWLLQLKVDSSVSLYLETGLLQPPLVLVTTNAMHPSPIGEWGYFPFQNRTLALMCVANTGRDPAVIQDPLTNPCTDALVCSLVGLPTDACRAYESLETPCLWKSLGRRSYRFPVNSQGLPIITYRFQKRDPCSLQGPQRGAHRGH